MNLKNPANICTPAQLYLGMSLISTIGFSANSVHFLATLWHLFMNLVWTYFLSFLCDKGHPGVAWFLILFPFLILMGIVFTFLYVVKNAKRSTTTSSKTAANTKQPTTSTESMVPEPYQM